MTERTGAELQQKAQAAWRDGEFSEELFVDCICKVFELSRVRYQREKLVPTTGDGRKARRCDIYIPGTDTAIEVKTTANLRGVGQCAFYAQHATEAVLLADGDPKKAGHTPHAQAACDQVPGVSYALAIPGPHRSPAKLQLKTDDSARFYDAGANGDLGTHEFLIKSRLSWGDD